MATKPKRRWWPRARTFMEDAGTTATFFDYLLRWGIPLGTFIVAAGPTIAAWIAGGVSAAWPQWLLFVIPVTALGITFVVMGFVARLRRRIAPPQIAGDAQAAQPQAESPPESTASESSEPSAVDDPRIANLKLQARWWEYKYLNLYLVPGTHLVLDWLSVQKAPVALNIYHAQFMVIAPQMSERTARLDALEAHYLIQHDDDGLILLTPKGQEYLQWRGPYPYPPPFGPTTTTPIATTVPPTAAALTSSPSIDENRS